MLNTVIGWILGAAALAFVLMLAGFASGALTDDPPAVNPYVSRSSDDGSDVFDTDAYNTRDTAVANAGSETTAAADQAATPAGAAVITIELFDFGDPIAVAAGQNVTVTNKDGVIHTWTSRDGVFDSGSIAPGGSFTVSLEEAGDYEFFCSIHSTMTGSITVTG